MQSTWAMEAASDSPEMLDACMLSTPAESSVKRENNKYCTAY